MYIFINNFTVNFLYLYIYTFARPSKISPKNNFKKVQIIMSKNSNLTANSVIKTYSNSFHSSKNQTPIKSPSPDHSHMNALTPTKVKYLIDQGKNVKAYQLPEFHESSHQTPNKMPSKGRIFNNARDSQQIIKKQAYSSNNLKRIQQNSDNMEYVKHLQQKIQGLEFQNKSLLRKLNLQKQNKLTHSPLSAISSNQGSASTGNQLRLDPFNISHNRRTQIITKIKQQYQQKINTLKMMVEQQIKEAIGVIQDMCQIMKNKIITTQDRVQKIEQKVSRIKMQKILKIEQGFNKTLNISGGAVRLNNSRKQFIGFNVNTLGENSLSDILCVSIPEQQQEQSKNYTFTITKLEQQIQGLKKTINQTHKVYLQQKKQLIEILNFKNNEISNLKQKLEQSQRKKHSIQWKYSKSIREELKLLQQNVNQLGYQLVKTQDQNQNILKVLEQKNKILQETQKQASQLKQRILRDEKQKIFYEQKIRFLQNNLQIIQHQLKERKRLLDEALNSKSNLQKQRINKISNQSQKYFTQRSVLTLTSRIDKLLLLQKQRQNVQKQMFESMRIASKQPRSINESVEYLERVESSKKVGSYQKMSNQPSFEESVRQRQNDKEQQTLTITQR